MAMLALLVTGDFPSKQKRGSNTCLLFLVFNTSVNVKCSWYYLHVDLFSSLRINGFVIVRSKR